MSDELTRKVIEAGIIPAQAVKQLKAWRMIPDDAPEEEKAATTEEQLLGFVREIDDLLERDQELPEMRETMLDLPRQFLVGANRATVVIQTGSSAGQRLIIDVPYIKDAMGRYIFSNNPPQGEAVARVGNQFKIGDNVFEIIEVEALYHGETREPRFYRCAVQGVPPHAQM